MEDFQKRFILALLAYGIKRDISPLRLCELSGIDFKALNKKTKTAIDASQINNLWKNASLLSGDFLFGLHFGESMQLAALGIIGQIVQTSNTVGEALTNAGALTHLITDMFLMQINHNKKTFAIHFIADKEKANEFPYTFKHMADYLMVFVIHELDGLVLEKIEPVSVQFSYPIVDLYEYSRVFRCPIRKKGADLAIEFNNKYLTQSILSANYELQNHLLQKINGLLKDTKEANTLQTKIYNYLLTNSYLNGMPQDAIAANFNISTRSLQRKLKEEGVTYLKIVDAARKTLAVSSLSSGNYQVKDIAYILGYSEQSAFIRAFKRWTNKTPIEYQKSMKPR